MSEQFFLGLGYISAGLGAGLVVLGAAGAMNWRVNSPGSRVGGGSGAGGGAEGWENFDGLNASIGWVASGSNAGLDGEVAGGAGAMNMRVNSPGSDLDSAGGGAMFTGSLKEPNRSMVGGAFGSGATVVIHVRNAAAPGSTRVTTNV